MVKLKWDGVEYGGPKGNWYYIYWWNWLKKEYRYFGPEYIYYDGPHRSFGFWYFNVAWSTQWTKCEDEK